MMIPTESATVPAKLRLADLAIRDPFIFADKSSGYYYLYATNVVEQSGEDVVGVMRYRSTDLIHWSEPLVVFTVPEGTWADPAENPWAPEVHEFGGKFALFITLHNPSSVLSTFPKTSWDQTMRGTVIALGDTPQGPFTMVHPEGPIPPSDFMTLDGTLYVDEEGAPWMVYAHEWVQKIDGTMEAIRLAPDLSGPVGEPIHLFKASDAPWINATMRPNAKESYYVTDGPQMFRTSAGVLLMLWSTGEDGKYVQSVARSTSGKIEGPWEQLDPIVREDSGHGMLFRTFEGTLMLAIHSPNHDARGRLYEMHDAGDHLEVLRPRPDLDGWTASV